SGAYLRTLQSDRHYERLDITGLTGVTEAQRTALLALGAVEHAPMPAHEHAPTPAPPPAPVRAPARPPTNLPPARTTFVGRGGDAERPGPARAAGPGPAGHAGRAPAGAAPAAAPGQLRACRGGLRRAGHPAAWSLPPATNPGHQPTPTGERGRGDLAGGHARG